jgi:hypothetical protein
MIFVFAFIDKSLKPLVPVLKSDTIPFGIASASIESGGYFAYQAFFDTFGWDSNSVNFLGSWVQYKFTKPRIVTSYKIQLPFVKATTFTLSASNDNINFNVLDTQSTGGGTTDSYFSIINKNAYLIYRITITVYTPGFTGAIRNLQFYGY